MIEISYSMLVGIAIYLYIMGMIILFTFGDLQFGDSILELIFDGVVIILYPISIPLIWLYSICDDNLSYFVQWIKRTNGKIISMNDIDE